MKAWIANLLWDAMWIFLRRVHDWFFNPERHARIRFQHRQRWWAYKLKTDQTQSERDNMRAEAWAIEFDFKTPPDEAVARGDLSLPNYPAH